MRPELPPIENLEEMIKEVRDTVLAEIEQNPDLYDPSDIDRCRNDDWTIERFIRRKMNVKDSAEMAISTMKWRKEMGMASLKDEDFPEEFWRIGAMFCYENDRFGNGSVYMRVKFHRKIKELDPEERKFILYNIEKMDRKTNGKGTVIVFDCKGAGISNLDMDMLWFLVSSLLNYYPFGLAYILVYELPWILQSAWAIVKGWLPAEHRNKIKFVNKDHITEYFEPENLPYFMGGTCKLDYHHVPKGCRTAAEFGHERGLKEQEIKKILKVFKPYLEEAEEETKSWELTCVN